MNVTFVVNGQDLAPVLSEFTIQKEITYDKVVKTLSGKEIPIGRSSRDVIVFRLYCTLEGHREDYRVLTAPTLEVEYDDPDTGWHKRNFRLACDLGKDFQMHSAALHTNIWKSEKITIRCLEVDR